MNPFEKIARSHQTLPHVDLAQGRSIASSRSTSSRLMELIDANARGTVHGGVIMRMVDEAASIVAFKHSQNPNVVTAKVETFHFLAPAWWTDKFNVAMVSSLETPFMTINRHQDKVEVLARFPHTRRR